MFITLPQSTLADAAATIIVDKHNVPTWLRHQIVYVCLECESIGQADHTASREDVHMMREHFDFTCCATRSTVYPSL